MASVMIEMDFDSSSYGSLLLQSLQLSAQIFSCQENLTNTKTMYKNLFLCAENEETEGSEGQAEYLFGDAELDDDDLYSMEHDNQAG